MRDFDVALCKAVGHLHCLRNDGILPQALRATLVKAGRVALSV